jgi:hypothetical protein
VIPLLAVWITGYALIPELIFMVNKQPLLAAMQSVESLAKYKPQKMERTSVCEAMVV